MNKTILQSLFCVFLLAFSGSSFAQVTIGSIIKPIDGALLDLKENAPDVNNVTSTKGLRLPRVSLSDLTPTTDADFAASIGATGTYNISKHIGLIVYNVAKVETAAKRICPGVHVWDGAAWQPLVPYLETTETRVQTATTLKGFTFLDPANPSDPNYGKWADFGKNPAQYQLGYQNTFTDLRDGEVYNQTRFYVGYTTIDYTYKITRNLSCDQNPASTAIVTTLKTIEENKFEDGLWMADNLRAIVMPDGTTIPTNTAASGTNPNSNTDPQIFYPGNVAGNRATLGVLYNWAAAMGGDPSAITTNQAGLAEGAPVQGICPAGWVLPSDRQYTDLENAIRINTSMFSTMDDGTYLTNIAYDTAAPSPIGAAMKSATSPTGFSKTAATGGFNALPAGLAFGGAADNYNFNAYLWSSSSSSSNSAWFRGLYHSFESVIRTPPDRFVFFSVRCKKD